MLVGVLLISEITPLWPAAEPVRASKPVDLEFITGATLEVKVLLPTMYQDEATVAVGRDPRVTIGVASELLGCIVRSPCRKVRGSVAPGEGAEGVSRLEKPAKTSEPMLIIKVCISVVCRVPLSRAILFELSVAIGVVPKAPNIMEPSPSGFATVVSDSEEVVLLDMSFVLVDDMGKGDVILEPWVENVSMYAAVVMVEAVVGFPSSRLSWTEESWVEVSETGVSDNRISGADKTALAIAAGTSLDIAPWLGKIRLDLVGPMDAS